MQDNKRKERIVRYKAKFKLIPPEILEQILDYLTIWSLISLKLTSARHFELFRSFLRNENFFHERRDRLFKPEQIGLFKLSWKNLLHRENVQPFLNRDMNQGLLKIAKTQKFFLDFSDEQYYKSINGFMRFSMTKLSDALRADCPKQFLECTTPIARIFEFIEGNIDGQDNTQLIKAFTLANEYEEFVTGDFAYLILLPYVMRAGATSCFEWSVRIFACISKASDKSLSSTTACMNFDITSLILSTRIPYFMERYFCLLTSVYHAGHAEILNVIEKYGEKNQLAIIKRCLPSLSKTQLKVLAMAANETGSERLTGLFPNIQINSKLLAKPRTNLMIELRSLLEYMEKNPVPSNLDKFQSRKLRLEMALEEVESGISDWAVFTSNQKESESELSTNSENASSMSFGS